MNRQSADNELPPGATSIHEPPLPGSRWFELKDTVALFLAAMKESNPNARVGLVTFGGGLDGTEHLASELDLEWARLENNLRVVISKKINKLQGTLDSYATDYPALGLGTSLYDGIVTGVNAFDNKSSSKHIVMLSDGNQVAPGRPGALEAIQFAVDEDITIHTISFGGDFGVMSSIADGTGGSNFTALSADELSEAFAQLLGRFRVQLVD